MKDTLLVPVKPRPVDFFKYFQFKEQDTTCCDKCCGLCNNFDMEKKHCLYIKNITDCTEYNIYLINEAYIKKWWRGICDAFKNWFPGSPVDTTHPTNFVRYEKVIESCWNCKHHQEIQKLPYYPKVPSILTATQYIPVITKRICVKDKPLHLCRSYKIDYNKIGIKPLLLLEQKG